MTGDSSNRLTLTPEQTAFFKENGYLVLRDVLDRNLCAQARDRMWASLPEGSHLKRDDPDTHYAPFPDHETSDDPLYIRRNERWHLREASTEQFLIDLIYCPDLCNVAEQLLGEGLLQPPVPDGEPMGSRGPAWPGGPTDPAIGDGVRGFYWTLPDRSKTANVDTAHTDGHPFNLGVIGVLNDVPEDGGAFTVWPGSHRRLYPTFQLQYDQPRIPYYDHMPSLKGIINPPEYDAELKAIKEDTQAVVCHGKEGDVVLWHHRLAHMAGNNNSDIIRQVVLNDFNRKDLDTCRLDPPQTNMWRDWSSEVNDTAVSYSVEFARDQGITSKVD